MRKALHVISAILSLCFLVFVILCTYSPVQPLSPVSDGAIEATKTDAEQAPKETLALPFITPKVTLMGGTFPEDAQEITVQLYSGETALLSQFTQLKRADFSGSANTEEIAAWAAANPGVEVRYTVKLPSGETVSNDVKSLDLSSVSAENLQETIKLLKLLPKLETLELGTLGGGGLALGDVAPLHEAFPNVKLNYQLQLLGQTLGESTTSVDLSGATQEEFAAALQVLGGLPNLKTIVLGAEGGNISWDNIWQLNAVCPNAIFDFSYPLCGVQTNLNAQSVNLSHVKMDDNGYSVKNVMPLMHACTYVDMDSCNVSNDAMREMRDAFPNTKFVWRIWFGTNYSVRTDVIKILASKPSQGGAVTNADVDALSCCSDIKYLDLGHNDSLTDISFVYGMPNLEVLIVALTGVSDISPLAACPKLEYLETTYTQVSDLTPLAELSNLAHINIGDCPVYDLTPLYNLTKLERVWLGMKTAQNIPQEQIDHIRAQIEPNRMDPNSPDTPREYQYAAVYGVDTEASTPSEGSWKFVGYTDLSLALYAETGWLQEVLSPRYKLLREQFGYDNLEYSFSWLDPLY